MACVSGMIEKSFVVPARETVMAFAEKTITFMRSQKARVFFPSEDPGNRKIFESGQFPLVFELIFNSR